LFCGPVALEQTPLCLQELPKPCTAGSLLHCLAEEPHGFARHLVGGSGDASVCEVEPVVKMVNSIN
jgi:hypothetical protein